MKIEIYCNDGSPLGVIPEDIYSRGVGGAELALMKLAEELGGRGHEVSIYNNPRVHGRHGNVLYLNQDQCPLRTDVFILFRSPNVKVRSVFAKKKLHWSTDQYTIGDFAKDIVPFVDQIVCISPRHLSYYTQRYEVPFEKVVYTDLGVDTDEYDSPNAHRDHTLIYCSVPDRGLAQTLQLWPRVKDQIPDARLIVTSDYSLWGADGPGNHQFRMMASGLKDVEFLGNIPRKELIELQKKAAVQMYPCTYDELFCISSAECQVAGAYPVTTWLGALATTNEWGRKVAGSPGEPGFDERYVQEVCNAVLNLTDVSRSVMMLRAASRFSWSRIADKWEQEILSC